MSTPARAGRLAQVISHLRRRGGEESGAVLLIVTVLMTAILASAALAIDVGSFYHAQRQAQAAADAGALAAAQDLGGAGSATAAGDGTTIAQTNYPGATVTVSEPTPTEAKVVVNADSPGVLGSALGVTGAKVSASAVAGVTVASTKCTSPGSGCLAIFAMDSNCTVNGIVFNGGGDTIDGGVWSNGSMRLDGGGDDLGPSYYGNAPGCQMIENGGSDTINGAFENESTNDPPGSTAVTATTTWPVDYNKDFPACGGTGELSCTGPCDVSASPCPTANRTPSFCTKATNAASEVLVTGSGLASDNIYCDIGAGTASDPTTWTGAITVQQYGSPVYATYVGGSFSMRGGGSELTACGYATSGYDVSNCSGAVPAPMTTNYPLVYAAGTGTPFEPDGGGDTFTGDIFVPNGSSTWNGGGNHLLGMLEAQTVTMNGGGVTGDGPPAGAIITSGGTTVSLLQ